MNALVSRPARAIIPALLGLLLAVGVLAAPTGAHAAENDVTWTVRTASNSFGAARTGFTYAVNPGASVDDALVVANHGSTPLDLGVYAADGYTTDSGQFDLKVAGAKSRAIGAWVTGTHDHITVAPGETQEFPFSVRVPKNATPGDYAGGIVTSLLQPNTEQGITVDRRLGIRISLRVGGAVTPSLTIENQHIDFTGGANPLASGDATMTYTLHNTGNATISATQAAHLSGPFGWLPFRSPTVAAPPQLLPGEKWTVTAKFHAIPAVVALVGTATVTPTMTDASGSTSALAPVSSSTVGWALPWMLIIVLLAIAALVVLAVRLRRRARTLQQEREDARVKEAVESALGGVQPATDTSSSLSPAGEVLSGVAADAQQR